MIVTSVIDSVYKWEDKGIYQIKLYNSWIFFGFHWYTETIWTHTDKLSSQALQRMTQSYVKSD
jgi:hypothetical protein